MSRVIVPVVESGGEFAITQPRVKAEAVVSQAAAAPPKDKSSSGASSSSRIPPIKHFCEDLLKQCGDLLQHHKLAAAAVLFLIIGIAAIQVGAHVWSAQNIAPPPVAIKVAARPISGFNRTIPAAQFESQLHTITSQPVTLTVGSQTTPVNSETIKSWLQITTNKNKSEYYLHVNEAAIAASLQKVADRSVKAPINQVAVDEDGASRVIVGGRNGTALSDPNGLKDQAKQVAKTVMDSKGMQFSTPLVSVPFQSVGPASFGKLLVADISSKKMWAYQNGQQVNSWLVSAGAPATPTPVGQFKIYARYSVQDMRGNNPDGTPYFQPHVRWVSYFYSGSAVHGVYWRPLSWFGNVNSSHGCIGLPEDQAKWVYDWAPIGTTVIVHT